MTVNEIREEFERLETMMQESKYSEIDQELENLNLNQASVDRIITYLTASLLCKDKLCHRDTYAKNVEMALLAREGKDRTYELLKGLI